ncbi:MAG: hypothetical protein IKV55_01685 [Oscillospiraceae bacterium]|nr:hypothetical protein [Oscillospiraceae bacterium]
MIYSIDSINEGVARLLPQQGEEKALLAYLSVLPAGSCEGALLEGEAGRGFKLLAEDTAARRAQLDAKLQALLRR